jgi:SAM-dependent methyltransferase
MVCVVMAFCSERYWDQRYRAGGTSGAGSRGEMAEHKATFINNFVADNAVANVLDFGCGDGHLVSLLKVPAYIGADVSAAALAHCATRFPQYRFMPMQSLDAALHADLVLSIDVIFHLVEDAVFGQYLHALFGHARRFVVIHSSNFDSAWPAPHVRHRRFTEYVADARPEWRLIAHLPTRFPYDPERPEDTSFADFYVYGRRALPCCLRIP